MVERALPMNGDLVKMRPYWLGEHGMEVDARMAWICYFTLQSRSSVLLTNEMCHNGLYAICAQDYFAYYGDGQRSQDVFHRVKMEVHLEMMMGELRRIRANRPVRPSIGERVAAAVSSFFGWATRVVGGLAPQVLWGQNRLEHALPFRSLGSEWS
jgi:hypothetical protein